MRQYALIHINVYQYASTYVNFTIIPPEIADIEPFLHNSEYF